VKGRSEPAFRAALNGLDEDFIVYKPPDDARNWKPCDFMVWYGLAGVAQSVWFEVKETPNVGVVDVMKLLRPAQKAGIERAHEVGVDYYIAVYWKRHEDWTILDAWRVVTFPDRRPLTRKECMSRFGVHAYPRDLATTARAVLLEGV